jgi:RNA polymerase sigma-70 factor (ECF subfamily)
LDGETLVREFHGRVRGYVRMRVPEEDCEDVIGDIFLRAIERLAELRGEPAPWLFAVARSQVAQYYRGREVEMRAVSEVRSSGTAASRRGLAPLERLEQAEFRALLRRKMNQVLSETERDALALKFSEGLDNLQIAALLGMPPNRLGVVLHRALGRLRAAMLEEVSDVVPGRV